MKKLLFAADLTPVSQQTLPYAIALANHFKAELQVLHVYELQRTSDAFLNLSDTIQKDLENEVETLIKHTIADMEVSVDLRISQLVQSGDPVWVIDEWGKKPEIDLVILGTKGKNAVESFFLGSVTRELVEKGDFPILVLTPGINWKTIKNICLPVDSQPLDAPEQLNPLLEIADKTQAKILAFHLETDDQDLGIHPSFESALALYNEKVKSSYHYELSEKEVLEAINTFGREYKADWICMLKRKKGLLKRLFEKSVTKTEIRLAQTPLLILPG